MWLVAARAHAVTRYLLLQADQWLQTQCYLAVVGAIAMWRNRAIEWREAGCGARRRLHCHANMRALIWGS